MGSAQSRPATIREVARFAGVGLGTVSRVLNDGASVSEKTRTKVLDAIRSLGYQPNLQARRLVRGRTETVGFFLGNRDFLDPFHAKMLCGAQRFLAGAGHHVVYTALEYSSSASSDDIVLPKVASLRGVLDGVIVAGTNYPNLLDALDRVAMPYVVFGNNLITATSRFSGDCVSFDDEGGTAELTQELIRLGHRRIGYVGHTEVPWFRRRYDGYARAMRASGLEPLLCSLAKTGDSTQFGYDAVCSLLDSGEPVSAVCCGNDAVAFGAAKAAREHGLKIPDDLSIAGFDDRDICFLTEPELSTVRPFLEKVGAECARVLLAKLNGSDAQGSEVVIPTEVVLRGSTGPCGSRVSRAAVA